MSFEGYCIVVCHRGHLLEEPYDYGGDDHAKVCLVCGAPWVWSYTVNQTNDSGVAPVLEVYRQDPNGNDDHDVFYLPAQQDSSRTALDYGVLDETSPPIKAAMWQDLDHPDDGPFMSEQAAWENKWDYFRRSNRVHAKEVRRAAKAAMKQQKSHARP